MSTASMFKVRFAIESEERFAALTRAFERIRECKAQDKWPDEKEDWTSYFDSKALGHFWWPTTAELKDWEKRYFSTPVPKRFTDPSLRHGWDFLSLFEAFKNGDYELHAIMRLSEEEAALPFDPHGHPYGGTGCMRALIEAFDHRVTDDPE
jgi:hypothetical protein